MSQPNPPLRVAFQMDPMESVDIEADTTFALAEVAAERGYALFEYSPGHLSYEEGRVVAAARPMQVRRRPGEHVAFEARRLIDLARDVDVVWMRQDPPFDMAYITAAHLLERLAGETLVVNDPGWVRSSPEKILPLDYPELMPPTLITRDAERLEAFRVRHCDVILKPLFGNGGAGVFRVREDDPNWNSLLEMFLDGTREPVIAQAYLAAVVEGDRRIILVDGEPVGGINRIPAAGETRSNMHVGGRAAPYALSDSDLAICAAIGPMLKRRGFVLTGIDVIGDKMTEINITSPTGVQELKRFSGVDAAALCWDAIESKLGAGAR